MKEASDLASALFMYLDPRVLPQRILLGNKQTQAPSKNILSIDTFTSHSLLHLFAPCTI